MYTENYKLKNPSTGNIEAIFQGYNDCGNEIWLTPNGIEICTFEGFTNDGWLTWSQNLQDFASVVKNVLN